PPKRTSGTLGRTYRMACRVQRLVHDTRTFTRGLHRMAAPQEQKSTEPSLDILLVEDEPDILESLEEVLEGRGHHVTAANDGAQAMGLLDHRHFDLAICDVRLPKVNGMQIFQRIRRESPS